MRRLAMGIVTASINNKFIDNKEFQVGRINGYGFGSSAKGIPASYIYRNKRNLANK